MSAIARPPGRHYVIIILLRADLSSVDGRRAPGHHSPGSQRGIRGGTAMPGPPPPPPPPPLTEPAVCRTGLNNIYHGAIGGPNAELEFRCHPRQTDPPRPPTSRIIVRTRFGFLLSLSYFRSFSLSLVSVMGSDATLSSVGEEDCDRMWARGLPIF